MGSSGLRLAKVTAVHPEGYAVDLVFMDTQAPMPWVQVLSWSASTNTGAMDLPQPTAPPKPYSPQDTKQRDIYAVVGFVADNPVVLGFLFPQVCELLFKDMDRKIERHASDWYTSVDSEGNFEASHPSGTYFRVGTSAAHEDLTGQDFDGKWAIAKNTDKAVYVHLSVKNAGTEVASLDINPSGDVALQCDRDLSADIGRDATLTVARNATATVHGNLTAHVYGNASAQVDGNASLTVSGTITSSAATWNHTGDINVTGTVTASTDVVGGGKHLKTHTHGGVQSGASNTGAPN